MGVNYDMSPLDYAARICYSSREVLQFTYEMGLKYKDYPGIYLEAGVGAGAQVIALGCSAPNKTIYALDSFQGIPLASNKDDQAPGLHFFTKAEQLALPDPGKQVLKSSGATSVPLKDVIEHIKNSGVSIKKIYFIEGWFEEILPEFECPPISILRLDADLYNSTYVCLQYLWNKVIKGGILIIDDYALPGCKLAVKDWFGLEPEGIKRVYSGDGSEVVYLIKEY